MVINMIPVNYHNHTKLCKHASGEINEYIENAISQGTVEFGFSDHAPIPLKIREDLSMDEADVEIYIESVLNAKEIYSDKIDIRLGFEVDFPLFDSFNKKYFSDTRIDYLIGSVHFIDNWAFDHPKYIHQFENSDIDNLYKKYFAISRKYSRKYSFKKYYTVSYF